MTNQPVSRQPATTSDLYPYKESWQNTLFGSFKPCPRSAYACFCALCYAAQLTDRVGDHTLTCCLNPCSLTAVRTKVRATYKIKGSLIEDCCVSACCTCPCSAMQIEHELNYRGVPEKRIK
ncbi:unnamed protein product [Rotaria socialis]|uniref:Uncharacterized protein n=1 Tax=Rotaria socialis TaxID=392032 RepID=A0A818CWL8_9BILA|nr:unnamed protein product [Rotaria socialis]CAF3168647.1 unnamed protein product [Rotaria socialis]CAF3305548.1 unnamed protein product [Rotaria socialis]CAF3345487.1 unnamed protein product [Rotaria socialis]CAF3433428.1 unnamed protein product [Rotaria socialis]